MQIANYLALTRLKRAASVVDLGENPVEFRAPKNIVAHDFGRVRFLRLSSKLREKASTFL